VKKCQVFNSKNLTFLLFLLIFEIKTMAKTIDRIITKVDSKYGSPMGRYNVGVRPVDGTKIYDCQVPMIGSGDYDKGGAYWGIGPQLRVAYTKDLSYICFYRKEKKHISYTYDGVAYITHNGEKVAQVSPQMDVAGIETLIYRIKDFIADNSVEADIFKIKNDNDQLGVIVDIWDNTQSVLVDTATYWFEDFIEPF
jgi:hypothetical protein